MVKKTNANLKIIIIGLIVLIVLLAGGLVCAYVFTDLFKSDEELFFKYLTQASDIAEIFQDEDLEAYGEKIKTTAYSNNGEITINTDGITSLDANEISILENSSISFSGNIDNANNYAYREYSVNYSDTESLDIEYVQLQDYYGVMIEGVVNKIIAIENNNLKEFATNMGVDEETVEQIPDSIDFDGLFTLTSDLFTDEELETLKTTYGNIFIENLTDDMFSSADSDDGVVYTLTITEEKALEISIKMLEQAKNDEIILNKIRTICIDDLGITEEETEELITKLQEVIQEIIDEYNSEDGTDTSTETDSYSTTETDSYSTTETDVDSTTQTDSYSTTQTDTTDTYTYSSTNTDTYVDTTNTITDSTDTEESGTTDIIIKVYVANKELQEIEILYDDISVAVQSSDSNISFVLANDTNTFLVDFTKTKTEDYLEYNMEMSQSDVTTISEEDTYSSNITNSNEESSSDNESYNMTLSFTGLGTDNTIESFGLTVPVSENTYVWNYTNTKDFTASFSEDEITTDDMLVINTASDLDTLTNLFDNIYSNLESLNDSQMENIGAETNPVIYYAPSLIPFVTQTAMIGNNVNFVTAGIGAGVVGVGLMVYNSAANTLTNLTTSTDSYDDTDSNALNEAEEEESADDESITDGAVSDEEEENIESEESSNADTDLSSEEISAHNAIYLSYVGEYVTATNVRLLFNELVSYNSTEETEGNVGIVANSSGIGEIVPDDEIVTSYGVAPSEIPEIDSSITYTVTAHYDETGLIDGLEIDD